MSIYRSIYSRRIEDGLSYALHLKRVCSLEPLSGLFFCAEGVPSGCAHLPNLRIL